MQNPERDTLVDTLLEALETERYVRAPLLLTVIDELSALPPFASAAGPAEELRAALEARAIDDAEYVRRVRALRGLVKDLRPSCLRLAAAGAA